MVALTVRSGEILLGACLRQTHDVLELHVLLQLRRFLRRQAPRSVTGYKLCNSRSR